MCSSDLWLLWRERQPLRRAFIVVCGTHLITPYAFNYDMGALSVVAALLAISGTLHSRTEVVVTSAVAVSAGAVFSLGTALLPVTPVVLAAGLLVVPSGLSIRSCVRSSCNSSLVPR